jgi:hypothetical protein
VISFDLQEEESIAHHSLPSNLSDHTARQSRQCMQVIGRWLASSPLDNRLVRRQVGLRCLGHRGRLVTEGMLHHVGLRTQLSWDFDCTAICKNRRLCAKNREIDVFAIVYFSELCPSYNLTTTHLTYNPFLYIRSTAFCNSFNLLFIPPRLLIKKF